MKTIEKKYYVCQHCGKSSTREDVIKNCEEKHRLITEDCMVDADFSKGKEFPGTLEITFPDGVQAVYSFEFCRDAKN